MHSGSTEICRVTANYRNFSDAGSSYFDSADREMPKISLKVTIHQDFGEARRPKNSDSVDAESPTYWTPLLRFCNQGGTTFPRPRRSYSRCKVADRAGQKRNVRRKNARRRLKKLPSAAAFHAHYDGRSRFLILCIEFVISNK